MMSNAVAVKEKFDEDTRIIGEKTDRFLELVYPSYLIDPSKISENYLEKDPSLLLDSMTFFRISCCSVENVDDLFESVNTKFEKLFAALHSINVPLGYGIISRSGVTNVVLCVYSSRDVTALKKITSGMLSGLELEEFSAKFCNKSFDNNSHGILSGVPTVYVKDKKQTFSLSSIMRTLNGSDYTLLFLAKPVKADFVKLQICDLIEIKDAAFAVSKRNIARNRSFTDNESHTITISDSKSHSDTVGGFAGIFIPPMVSVGGSYAHSYSRSHSEGYSDTISKAVSAGETIAADIQNGFALELMNYADKAIERLKCSQNNGLWQTAICYSADSEITRNIIKACLCGELSKPDPDKLPLLAFDFDNIGKQPLGLPKFLSDKNATVNPLCSYLNSSELGLLCTVPTESVPDFELRTTKQFPMIKSTDTDTLPLGYVSDGKRKLENMPFAISSKDLNKHTFVCGITGSGKTRTVKRILASTGKPFMVIESAKKEYRNIKIPDVTTYTLGKPELNCPQINPFYIMPGVSPQTHIDALKDLFIASFSFYGPMPYILEKCLHNVYKNKGWDLKLGFHPLLANTKNQIDFFDIKYIEKQYAKSAHRYLFPTMQELKDEIERYVKEEMSYDGEVAGNIKTAIKVRLENLCVGAKGFMFNTCEHLDFSELLQKNTVFELEGLTDDSDKAFCVGLMVIFINEYRQTLKENRGSSKTELAHLLVIEEAHRLLKNVETERSTENSGNPKGKAVEYFTNMIAEMRSYGQGVIIAEQIPSKLAPDVIKNTSNKIIQRIVSADDQQIIANTIGISPNDAIQLGTLETQHALCHKEGMALPVFVRIEDVDINSVSDEILYNNDIQNRMSKIRFNSVNEILAEDIATKSVIIRLLNTILSEDSDLIVKACKETVSRLNSVLIKKAVNPVFLYDVDKNIASVVVATIINFLVRGIYATTMLPDDTFSHELLELIYTPNINSAEKIVRQLATLYGQNTQSYCRRILVVEMIKPKLNPKTDVVSSIKEFFLSVSDKTVKEIEMKLKKDVSI
jgi:hypothetical protein